MAPPLWAMREDRPGAMAKAQVTLQASLPPRDVRVLSYSFFSEEQRLKPVNMFHGLGIRD